MVTTTQDSAIEAAPEHKKQSEYVEGFLDYRVFGIEKKLDDVTHDIRDLRAHVYNLDSRLSSRIDQLDSKLNSRIDQLDSKLDSKIDQLDSKLNSRIDQLDSKLNSRIDQLGSKLDSRMDKLEDRMWLLLLGVALSILAPILLRFL